MARLLIKTLGLERSIVLKLGANRIGRSPESDFQIVHPTVSNLHCELQLTDNGIILRDLESTNGTSVDGKPVREALLTAGQTIHLGDIELFVESVDATVAIPKFINPELPAPPPVSKKDGSPVCPRHLQSPVTHQCTMCKEMMCDACVHRLSRKGGKIVLLLCPICSNAVEPIGGKRKRKSLFSRVGETVKLRFMRGASSPDKHS